METFIKKWWFVLVYLALYFIAINLLVLNRWWQFEALYFDHGIYDSALWQAAHFQIPLIDHLEKLPIRQWGDHFTPTLYLLIPLYWLTSSYEPILVLQNFFVVATAFVLFLMASKRIPNRALVFALSIAFTLFIGLQNFLISNFHSEALSIILLALTLFFMEKKKWLWFWFFLILTFGTKQNYAAIGMGLGIYLILAKISWRMGAAVVVSSILYYFAATNIFIPFFGEREYWYQTTLNHPFFPIVKIQTILSSFATFGFLPLFGLAFLPAIVQDFFTRFVLNSGSARWDLGMHYNATLAVLLAFGAIVGTSWLLKFKVYGKIVSLHAILIVVIVIFLHQFQFHGPIGLVFNRDFYKNTERFVFLRRFVDEIPQGGLLMTQNNLAPYLTHAHKVMLLRENYWDFKPDLIAIDTRDGQNPANYWPLPPFNFGKLQKNLANDKNYRVRKITEQQLIYARLQSPKERLGTQD